MGSENSCKIKEQSPQNVFSSYGFLGTGLSGSISNTWKGRLSVLNTSSAASRAGSSERQVVNLADVLAIHDCSRPLSIEHHIYLWGIHPITILSYSYCAKVAHPVIRFSNYFDGCTWNTAEGRWGRCWSSMVWGCSDWLPHCRWNSLWRQCICGLWTKLS